MDGVVVIVATVRYRTTRYRTKIRTLSRFFFNRVVSFVRHDVGVVFGVWW